MGRGWALLVLGIFLPVNTVLAADLGGEIQLKPVKGDDVASMFALQCAPDTFATFAQWARRSGYLGKTHQVRDKKATIRGRTINFPSGVEITALEGGRYRLVAGRRKHTGSDLCDLFMQTRNKSTASLHSFSLIQPAWAELVEESTSYIGVAAGALVAVAGGAAAFLNPWAGVGMITLGATMSVNAWADREVRVHMMTALNQKFSLYCDKYETIMESSDYRIRVDKRVTPRDTVNMKIEVSKKEADRAFGPPRYIPVVNDEDSYAARRSRELILTVAKNCENQEEAVTWLQALDERRERTRKNMDVLTAANTNKSPNRSSGSPAGDR